MGFLAPPLFFWGVSNNYIRNKALMRCLELEEKKGKEKKEKGKTKESVEEILMCLILCFINFFLISSPTKLGKTYFLSFPSFLYFQTNPKGMPPVYKKISQKKRPYTLA